MGLIPGQRRFHMPWATKPRVATTTEVHKPRACTPHQEKPLQRRAALLAATRESLHTATKVQHSQKQISWENFHYQFRKCPFLLVKWNRLFSKLKIPDVETSYTWETPAFFPPWNPPEQKVFPEWASSAAAHGVCVCVTFSQVPSYKMEFRTPLALKTL